MWDDNKLTHLQFPRFFVHVRASSSVRCHGFYAAVALLKKMRSLSQREVADRVAAVAECVLASHRALRKRRVAKTLRPGSERIRLLGFDGFFVMLRTRDTSPEWLEHFARQVWVETSSTCFRIAGDYDYMLENCCEKHERFLIDLSATDRQGRVATGYIAYDWHRRRRSARPLPV